MIKYIIASVGTTLKLERHCPHCHRSNGNVHSGIYYWLISDVKMATIAQQRMKRLWCKTT